MDLSKFGIPCSNCGYRVQIIGPGRIAYPTCPFCGKKLDNYMEEIDQTIPDGDFFGFLAEFFKGNKRINHKELAKLFDCSLEKIEMLSQREQTAFMIISSEQNRDEFIVKPIPWFISKILWQNPPKPSAPIPSPSITLSEDNIKQQDLVKISPRNFEKLVGLLFKKEGWETTVTKYRQDKGVDVILAHPDSPNDKKGAVQCKQFSRKSVPINHIRKTSNLLHRNYDFALLITNSAFTDRSRREAERIRDLGLIDGEQLIYRLAKAGITKNNETFLKYNESTK